MRSWFVLFAALALACTPELADRRPAQIEEVITAYHSYHQFDGVVLVADSGRIVYEGAFGWADVGLGVQNTLDTRFRVASLTKVFTATVVLQLADAGLVGLDAPVGDYLPGLREGLAEEVTIRNLLTHTSGLAREYLSESEDTQRDYSTSELVRAVDENALFVHSPGERVSYSNSGYVLLAAVVERVTGFRYREAVRQYILEPLGMEDTGFEEGMAVVAPGLADGHRLRLGTYIHAQRGGMSWTRGNGGIYSTARDLLRYDRGLRSGDLLSDSANALMFERGTDVFAIPWQVDTDPAGYPDRVGRLAWARGANPGGFRAQWTMQLDEDRTVILLANLDYSPRQDITQKVFQILLGETPSPPNKPASLVVLERLDREGVGAALAALRELDEGAAGVAINDLLELGHHRIRAQRPSDAVPLFELANAAYPDDPGVLVSLAFGHLEAGDPS